MLGELLGAGNPREPTSHNEHVVVSLTRHRLSSKRRQHAELAGRYAYRPTGDVKLGITPRG